MHDTERAGFLKNATQQCHLVASPPSPLNPLVSRSFVCCRIPVFWHVEAVVRAAVACS